MPDRHDSDHPVPTPAFIRFTALFALTVLLVAGPMIDTVLRAGGMTPPWTFPSFMHAAWWPLAALAFTLPVWKLADR